MRRLVGLVTVLFLLAMSVPAMASIYDISVTGSGDQVKYRYWGYFGSGTWWEANANPNIVYHSYEPGNGNSADTALSFDLTSLTVSAEDILSASLNFNILSVWTDGRDDIGNINGIGTVYASGGTGWKSFDITTSLIDNLNAAGTTANYYFSYTGYSGFTFGSAEGGQPAYLSITTASNTPVPLPAAAWIFGSGLLGLFQIRRKLSR
ncbi:VPLPA-CTERM protein sorting domain-containing protein [Syntrophus gentianae]|uniref:VPLPA-CTERM protein sorting domain-containing protein n=1 Tax=Syntrophus gentianae TaxID=43775 RepID=A0A1H7XV48_9BACT|nr:VPLPA-CTERM sorting domain-containing protein [Syntrophus gentianae]SEM37812.1 VPLPA-CTERM protein sorting domain-containing protein [Syntrophus gentianae]